jgi:uncharacterized membrane protein YfhO
MQGIVRSLLSDGYPALTTRSSSSGNSLAYLFNTTAISGAKSVYANANHLFTLDSNGYYKYDSDLNYAYLDTSTKNFTVYNGTFDLTDGSPVGFFPLRVRQHENLRRIQQLLQPPLRHDGGTDS